MFEPRYLIPPEKIENDRIVRLETLLVSGHYIRMYDSEL